ncbi:MAG: pyridoxal phosphate-dependent aminotransferase [Methanomassiliicoccales archaeon]
MRFEPFLLEEWLLRCRGACIDMDRSGAPEPYEEGFRPKVNDWEIDEFEAEERLYEAISRAYGAERSKIALTPGAQAANYALYESCFSRKDMGLIEEPTYAPMRACTKAFFSAFGMVPRKKENDFSPDIEVLERDLKKGAKVVSLTNLHNPSGKRIDDEEMRAIIEVAEEQEAFVLVDEVYREMCYSRPPRSAFLLGDNCVITNGMSKLFGLGKLRVGWLIGPEEVAKRVNESRLYSSWRLPSRSMEIAIAALERKDWFRERVLRISSRNLPLIRDWAEDSGLEITEPDGGLHLLLHLPAGLDDEVFAQRLLRHRSTAVCPGRYFGIPGSVRMTFSLEGQELSQGLENILHVLRSSDSRS